MSSLGDIQQIYIMLQEIDRLLAHVEVQSRATERQLTNTIESFNSVEQVALRYLTLLNRANLPEDQQQLITVLAQVAVAARAAQMAVTSFMMATGPTGILFATLGLVMAGVSGIESVNMYMRRHS